MVNKELLGGLSLIICAAGNVVYIRSILQGKTKPHAFSWAVWALLSLMVFYAQYIKGAGAGAWVTGLITVLNIAIAVLALKYGEKDIRRSDWVSFICALLVVPVWYVTDDPLLAVIIIIIIDAFGYYPTFRKCFYNPYQENMTLYVTGGLQVPFSLLAMGEYSLVNILYPLSLVIGNTALIIMVLYMRKVRA